MQKCDSGFFVLYDVLGLRRKCSSKRTLVKKRYLKKKLPKNVLNTQTWVIRITTYIAVDFKLDIPSAMNVIYTSEIYQICKHSINYKF